MTLQQGDCVHLAIDEGARHQSARDQRASDPFASDEALYQVIAVDDPHHRCWVRLWPLARHGSPVFEVSLSQVREIHRLHPQTCQSRS